MTNPRPVSDGRPTAPDGWLRLLALAPLFLAFACLLPTYVRSAPPPAAEAAKKSFSIPADLAEAALNRFAVQSGQEVLFATRTAGRVQTNKVSGEFTAREAIDRMLAGTGLVAEQDSRTGAWTISSAANGPKPAPGPAGTPEKKDERAARELAGAVASAAPESAAARDDETVQLSPFVVTSETGWNATETLSGTRLRTDYKDLGNQLETFTKDFMEDLAVNSIEEALIYSMNGENDLEIVEEDGDSRAKYISQTPGRVRGIGNATRLRGSFKTFLPSDNYNLDRVTLASGANSILFGLGSSAGAFDASPMRGSLQRGLKVKLQYSSEDSYRSSFSANNVLVKDAVALRVSALKANTQTHKKPNWNKSDRLHLALLVKPFKNTTINASIEHVSIDANLASRSVNSDRLTPWLLADKIPNSPYTQARPAFDNSKPFNGTTLPTTSRIFAAIQSQATFIANDPSMAPQGWSNAANVISPAAVTVFGVPDPSFDSTSNRTFLDGSVVPLDVNLYGKLRTTRLNGNIRTLSLEQKIARDLFLEVAYNREKTGQQVIGPDSGYIYLDPNLYLPNILPGETTQRPNPYFGLPYIQYNLAQHQYKFGAEEWRSTLSYDLDLGRKFSHSGWAKWLGRHRFMGLAEGSHRTELTQVFVYSRMLDDAYIPGRTLLAVGTANWGIATNRLTHIRAYLVGPDGKFDPYAQIEPIAPLGESFDYLDGNGEKRHVTQGLTGWTDPKSGKRISTANTPVNGRTTAGDAQLGVWQGYFLPDRAGNNRLVITTGYRRDSLRFAVQDAATIAPDFSGLKPTIDDATFNPLGPKASGFTRTTGAVLRPLSWFGVFYSTSSTFDIGNTFFDPDGHTYPGAGGSGYDRGVQIDLWGDKISLRVNQYETTLGPVATTGGRIGAMMDVAAKIEARVRALDPQIERIGAGTGGFPDLGFQNYRATVDSTSEGYELSLNMRPTRNWNIRINGAKSKAISDNEAVDWIAWIAKRLPVWESVVAKNGEVDATGKPLTWATALYVNQDRSLKTVYEEDLLEDDINVIVAGGGRSTAGARGYRANFITNYRFSEGRLRGLSMGFAARWRTSPIIGYPVKVIAGGNKVLDIENPYRGRTEIPVDASIGYRGRMKYFGDIPYNLQLNIRNLLNDNKPVPVKTYSDGTVSRLATQEPRLFITSLDFEF